MLPILISPIEVSIFRKDTSKVVQDINSKTAHRYIPKLEEKKVKAQVEFFTKDQIDMKNTGVSSDTIGYLVITSKSYDAINPRVQKGDHVKMGNDTETYYIDEIRPNSCNTGLNKHSLYMIYFSDRQPTK